MLETNDNHRKLIRELKEMYETYMDDQDLTIHNTEATRFWSGCRPSLLDQFVSDCPSFIDNVTSYHGHISDHDIVTMQYHTNELKEEQQFRMVRNWANLTPENMMVMIMKNVKLNSILSMHQTNKVWNIFLEEINTIINTLAPAHIIQIKSNHEPYMNEELKEYVKEADEQLDKAITSGAIEEWRLYRQLRNQLYKWIENSKKIHFQNILSTTKNMWKTVQKYGTKMSNKIPSRIIVDGLMTNSPKKVANAMNSFYIEKVKSIRKAFTKPEMKLIKLLAKLIPREETECKIPEITLEEVKEIIKETKSSNTVGCDNISSRIIKMIPNTMAVFITHSINVSIREGIFPEILKISRILPISKPGKDILKMESYRPISNLEAIEKIYEEHIKRNLMKHFIGKRIILEEHHGGLQNHSTITAKSIIDYYAAKSIEEDKLSVILSTDLSMAFDVVDHVILTEKLRHYGVRGHSLNLMKSYLSKRMQYVELNTKKSRILVQEPCSVVQGSRISGLLYTIFVNEIPLLHNLLQDKETVQKLLKSELQVNEPVEHVVTQFVDDSNSNIIFDNPEDAKEYINRYFKLLDRYYNMMKLKINHDKSNLMTICKPKHNIIAKEIVISHDSQTIKPKAQFKILGFISNARGSYDSHMNSVISSVNHQLYTVKELSKYMTEGIKLKYANSVIKGKLNYGLPMLIGETNFVKEKYYRAVMKTARWVRGSYCFKESVSSILKSLNWKHPEADIDEAAAKLTHKMISKQEPRSIVKKIRMQRTREGTNISMHKYGKMKRFNSTFINMTYKVYNRIPKDLRALTPKQLKIKLLKTKLKPKED